MLGALHAGMIRPTKTPYDWTARPHCVSAKFPRCEIVLDYVPVAARIEKDSDVYDIGAVHGQVRRCAAVVLRKNIGVAVTVEISCLGAMPGGSGIGLGCSPAEVGAVHDPGGDQTGRSGRLDHRPGNADRPIAVEVLLETGLG